MAQATNVLITGANRGIGKHLLGIYLARPNHTVIAALRDPEHATAKALADLPKGQGSRLVVVKLDAGVPSDAAAAVQQLEGADHNISHLDLVIANAGIMGKCPRVEDLELAELQRHIDVNVYGVVTLFQATKPLLRKSSQQPKFVSLGSRAGSFVTDFEGVPNAAYAPSKTVVHKLTRMIDLEEKWLVAFPVCPGFTLTDMGRAGGVELGLDAEKMAGSVEAATAGLVKVIDAATKETHGGKLWGFEGVQLPW